MSTDIADRMAEHLYRKHGVCLKAEVLRDAIEACASRVPPTHITAVSPELQEHLEKRKLERELTSAKMEAKYLQGFADLWYFAMDQAPGDFERIVTTCSPDSWMHEIAKIKRGER